MPVTDAMSDSDIPINDGDFLHSVRAGKPLSQGTIAAFVTTHPVVDAQYEDSGDGDERLSKVFSIGDTHIAVSAATTDVDGETTSWCQPCEVKRIRMKRVMGFYRWVPVCYRPFTTLVNDDLSVPLATDYIAFAIKTLNQVLASKGILPADIRIINVQFRYEIGDGDGKDGKSSVVCLIRTKQGEMIDITLDLPETLPVDSNMLSNGSGNTKASVYSYQVNYPRLKSWACVFGGDVSWRKVRA